MTTTSIASGHVLPPTPPKEKSLHEALNGFIDLLEPDSDTKIKAASLETPPPTSSPSRDNRRRSPSVHKKIRFLSEPTFSDELYPSDDALDRLVPLRAIPPSKYQRSNKSILKRQPSSDDAVHPALDANYPLPEDHLEEKQTPITMLESVVKQLASGDYASRVDSYVTLNRAFKAYKNEPNRQALVAQIPQFQDFLRRDLAAVSQVTNAPDAKIISQALKLTANFFMDSSLPKRISIDFIGFLVDFCISGIEGLGLPKEVVKNQLYLLQLDRLLQRGLSSTRAVKVIEALSTIHDRVSGKNVLHLRLCIVEKFHTYASAALTSRPHAWVPFLFRGILHDSSYIRDLAINVASLCSIAFGRVKNVTSAVKAFFDETSSAGLTHFDEIHAHLTSLLETKHDILHVPRLCALVIMFMRGPQNRIEEWSRLTTWLRLFQNCLNSSDYALNIEAFTAWNFMIHASSPSKATSEQLRKSLPQPVVSIMRRPVRQDHMSFQVRSAALSTYCYLLNNAFKPPNSAEQSDLFWTEYVVNAVAQFRIILETDLQSISRILSAFLRTSKLTVWDANRYESTHENPVAPEEVPRLEPSWIRRNTASVLQVLEHLIVAQLSLNCKHDYASGVFTDFLWAVDEAGKRDIKLSSDLKCCLANVLSMMQRLMASTSLPRRHNAVVKVLVQFARCLQTSLGPALLEERLLIRQENGDFDVLRSPARTSSEPQSTTSLIIGVMSSSSKSGDLDSECTSKLQEFLSAGLQPLAQRKAKLHTLRNYARQTIVKDDAAKQDLWLWRSVASVASNVLALECNGSDASARDQGLAHDYRYIVQILEVGFQLPGQDFHDTYAHLVNKFITVVKAETGDAGVLLAVATPIVEALLRIGVHVIPDAALICLTALLQAPINGPNDRMVEKTKRLLWKDDEMAAPIVDDDWLVPLCTIINDLLVLNFGTIGQHTEPVTAFVEALKTLSEESMIMSRTTFLSTCQTGLCAFAKHASPTADRNHAHVVAWNRVLHLLTRTSQEDAASIRELQNLLCAGFGSNNLEIASSTVEWWNSHSENFDNIECPSELYNTLVKLHAVAHVNLPSLSHAQHGTDMPHSELQALFPWTIHLEVGAKNGAAEAAPAKTAPTPIQFSKPKSFFGGQAGAASSSSPRRTQLISVKSKTPAKLRHDDSQIQFIPIDSSPMNQESQVLTEHQKDVRERQADQGRAFYGFPSSPTPSRFTRAEPMPLQTQGPRALDLPSASMPRSPAFNDYEAGSDEDIFDLPPSPVKQANQLDPGLRVESSETNIVNETEKIQEPSVIESVKTRAAEEDWPAERLGEAFDNESGNQEPQSGSVNVASKIGDDASEEPRIEDFLQPREPMDGQTVDEEYDSHALRETSRGQVQSSDIEEQAAEDELAVPGTPEPIQPLESLAIEDTSSSPAKASIGKSRQQPSKQTNQLDSTSEALPTRQAPRNSQRNVQSSTVTRRKSPRRGVTPGQGELGAPSESVVKVVISAGKKRAHDTRADISTSKRIRVDQAAEIECVNSTVVPPRELLVSSRLSCTNFKELYDATKRELRRAKGLSLELKTNKSRLIAGKARNNSASQELSPPSGRASRRSNSRQALPSGEQLSQSHPRSQRLTRSSSGSAEFLSLPNESTQRKRRRNETEDNQSVTESCDTPLAKILKLEDVRGSSDSDHVTDSQRRTRAGRSRRPGSQAEQDHWAPDGASRTTRRATARQSIRPSASPPPSPDLRTGEAMPQPETPKAADKNEMMLQTPPNRVAAAHSPPSSQTFALTLSGRAQRVINALREAFTAAQQMLQWPTNARQSDEIEDLEIDLRNQLHKVRRSRHTENA